MRGRGTRIRHVRPGSGANSGKGSYKLMRGRTSRRGDDRPQPQEVRVHLPGVAELLGALIRDGSRVGAPRLQLAGRDHRGGGALLEGWYGGIVAEPDVAGNGRRAGPE